MKNRLSLIACILIVGSHASIMGCSLNHPPYWWIRGDYDIWLIDIHYNHYYTWNAHSEFKLFEWDDEAQEYFDIEYYGWRDAVNAYTEWPGTMLERDVEFSWCRVAVDSIPIKHETKWNSVVQSIYYPDMYAEVTLINQWYFFNP